ncbi:MAG TPA: NAD(+) synthase [Thermodesulfobacteriota bacterium]
MPAAAHRPGEAELVLDAGLASRVLTEFIREEVTKVGPERVAVGPSGGIGSPPAAAPAARALGSRNVTALAMPNRTSGPERLRHAREVTEQLNLEVRTIEIAPMIDAYLRHDEPDADAVRRGNETARERMAVLHHDSAEPRALVLETGNEIIEKTPSADLWAGQSDEGDRLLFFLVDRRYRRDECVAPGFAPARADTVRARVQGSPFTRRLPVIAKLSHRTIDRDFRHARDWGT